jgi:hypothetical protein
MYIDAMTAFQKATPVKDDPEFKRVAAENQWFTRQARGIARKTSIFEYLAAVYKPWIGKGMTQADLLAVDKSAWGALQNGLRTEKLPEWLPLPKKSDADIADISDPEILRDRLTARSPNRERMRIMYRLGKTIKRSDRKSICSGLTVAEKFRISRISPFMTNFLHFREKHTACSLQS